MRIRAAVLEESGAPLAVQDIDLAGPAPGEVLVRLPACGVCHTARHASCSAPAWSGWERWPAPACRARSGSSASTSPRSASSSRGQGATDVLLGGDTEARVLEMTDGFGADYAFEATGNVGVMRQAAEAARMGEIDVEPLVSRTMALDDVNHAFELMEAQQGIRSVISFGAAP